MTEAQRSFQIFLIFIKNTEKMVKAISSQNKFTSDISLQISVLDDMIEGLNNLKSDLEGIINPSQTEQDYLFYHQLTMESFDNTVYLMKYLIF